MKSALKTVALLLVLPAVVAAAALWHVMQQGVGARDQPGRLETYVAGSIRDLAIARRARSLRNPIDSSADAVADGRAHFADHCAICHANDGSGQTPMGQGMWPKPPDMRQSRTQDLSDGELFWIIENGIRFTGMPGWGTGTEEGELASWRLVHFIRRLPKLTDEELEEMASLNPKPPAEVRQQILEEEFLKGNDVTLPDAGAATHKHPGGHDD